MSAQVATRTLPEWPEYGLIDDLLRTLTTWSRDGKRAALATLVHVEGSSPRPTGSELTISDTGEIAGYVSGGCVEAAIATEARACLADGQPRLLDYGAGSPVLDIQLSCGGRIGIFLRPIPDLWAYVRPLTAARAAREPIHVTTDLHTGAMTISPQRPRLPPSDPPRYFTRTHMPPTHLILAGRDPVTLALLRLARSMDITTTLLAPFGPAASPPGHTLAGYDRRALGTAIPALRFDRWTAVYALSHDANTDLALAEHALKSEAFCVGILGSRSKITARREALRQRGIPDADLERLDLPAGMDIGARTPTEIALSILAQIVAARHASDIDDTPTGT